MEWKEVTLGEIGTIVGGATPSTKNTSFYDGNIPWLTPKDLSVNSNKYILRGERNITEAGFKSCSCKMLPKGSVLFSSRAPIGYVAIAANDMCTNQGFKSVIPNEETDGEFLYYLLKYNKDNIASQGSGTTFAEVSGKTMKEIEVVVPKEKEDQRRIASILSSLDRKIELNNKINADLEEMAQAIFKNWFVDFEPFKDGKFVDSELGMIPKGWNVGRLDEIADVVGGSTPSKAKPEYYTQKGIAWLTPKDLSNHPAVYSSRGEIDITEEGYNSTSTKLMPKGTILFTSRAPIGYISIAQNDICTNQGFKSLVPKKAGTCFLYCFLKYVTPEIENKSTGSTFKEASGSLMKSLQVIMPEQKVFEDFETIVSPLFARIESLEKENSRLSLLRDTLLPRLMSGELEVPE